MPMNITHWRAEWLRFRRDRANLLVLALFALLALAAAINGVREVRQGAVAQQQATLDAEQRLARMRQDVQAIAPDRPLVAQGIDPASPAKLAFGDGTFHVGLPPAAGAALAQGTATVLPQSIEVSTRSRHTQAANQNLVNPASLGAGSFDLAFVVTTLLPLAAIALAWRVQAYDRELGTWRLIAAVPGAARGLVVSALLLRLALLCLAAWLAGADCSCSCRPKARTVRLSAPRLARMLGRYSLIATGRSSSTSTALYVIPKPPAPSKATIR